MTITVAKTQVDELKMFERLHEVMQALGFTKPNTFAKLIGMSHSTFGRILKNERPLSECKLIADGLGISVERMMGNDVKSGMQEVSDLIVTNPLKAIELGEKMRLIAIGTTETVDVLNQLGIAYKQIGNYQECASLWQTTLDTLIDNKPNDIKRIARSVKNVIFAYGKTQEIDKRVRVVETASKLFSDNPKLVAQYLYIKGVNEKLLIKYSDANESLQKSYDIYKELDDKRYIGRCLTVMGEVSYLEGKYQKAFDLLEIAKERAFKDELEFVQYFTDLYVKTSSSLGRFDFALNLVEQVKGILSETVFNDVSSNGKMLFYYEFLNENINNPRKLSLLQSLLS